MFGKYKVVCNTAAGRRRYMQYLVPQVLNSDVVDRYDIWVNTTDVKDIEFFRLLAKQYDKIRLVWQPQGIVDGVNSINAFYEECVEDDTIYVKLDDDVVWIEPGFFEKMVDFRISHPEYFLVSPLVINNQKSTYILQCMGKLDVINYRRADPFDRIFLKSGKFAAELHNWFIDRYLTSSEYGQLHSGAFPLGLTRFSINAILWFGYQMKEFEGVVTGDDEEFLSSVMPTRLRKSNCLFTDAIVCHFAFGPQRKYLDGMGILEKYGETLHRLWSRDARMKQLDDFVQSCKSRVDALSEAECKELPRPDYVVPKHGNKLMKRIKTLIGEQKQYIRQ